MKHRKSLLAAILVVILLTSTVSGTIAYLKTQTGTVTNTFKPTQVDTEVQETIAGNEKTFIGVTNPQNDKSIPAYVRIAIAGNWCDDQGNIVKEWHPTFNYNDSDWVKAEVVEGELAYYYYKYILEVGDTTENLLGEGESISMVSAEIGYEGLHLEVTVMQQAIQAEPASAVESVWPVQVGTDGTLSLKGN